MKHSIDEYIKEEGQKMLQSDKTYAKCLCCNGVVFEYTGLEEKMLKCMRCGEDILNLNMGAWVMPKEKKQAIEADFDTILAMILAAVGLVVFLGYFVYKIATNQGGSF